MKEGPTYGEDDIMARNLKLQLLLVLNPLEIVFNKILARGLSPKVLKVSVIVPIYKRTGSKTDPQNYRPVSLTSCISRTCVFFKKV